MFKTVFNIFPGNYKYTWGPYHKLQLLHFPNSVTSDIVSAALHHCIHAHNVGFKSSLELCVKFD